MSIITLSNVAARAGDTLFQNLTLSIGPGDRVGIVAGNGAGKTTLLRIVAGEAEPAEGAVTLTRGTTLARMEQEIPPRLAGLTLREAVLDALDPVTRESEGWRADIVLADLEMPETFQDRRIGELSGGWQRMALLARAWIAEPDALLLDEPTNHLDLSRILALERFLNGPARAVPMLIASHDRYFLDTVTTRTLFLRPGVSLVVPQPFSNARAVLEERDAADARAQEKDLKEARRLRRNAAHLNNVGINSGSDLLQVKASQLRARADRIEEAQRELHRERPGQIELSNRGTHARLAVALEGLEVSAPDGRSLFKAEKTHIFAGDRVALLGANGSGKTRLMLLLAPALAGETVPGIRTAASLVAGVADQALSHVPDAMTPHGWLTGRFDQPDQRARALLAAAGIDILFQERRIATLSMGQRSRLGMLGLRLAAPNIYLLDEPTNHLDIVGQETLETEILEKGATVILVSHDRAFVSAIATRWLEIRRGRLVEVDGPEAFYADMGSSAGA